MRNIELTFISAINALPRALQEVVDSVEHETGYAMMIIWGGPQVREDGSIGTWRYVRSLYCISLYSTNDVFNSVSVESGKTTTESSFSSWHGNWEEGVIGRFGKFLNECYRECRLKERDKYNEPL